MLLDDLPTPEQLRTLPSMFHNTIIGHAKLAYLNPLSGARLAAVTSLIDPPDGGLYLDIGCGKGTYLMDLLAARPGARGLGLDINPHFAAIAEAEACRRGVPDRVSFILGSAEQHLPQAGSVSVLVSHGASQALGGVEPFLATAARLLARGGLLILGEAHWRRPPDPAYLAILGGGPDEISDHRGTAALAQSAGFDLLASMTASDEEWDWYEGYYCRNRLDWARRYPAEALAADLAARARSWHEAYLTWGRTTLGFGLYLLRKP